MDVREKLVELLGNLFCGDYGIDGCDSCKYNTEVMCSAHACADRLIANGVTVQEWISVNDRLPDVGDSYIVCGKMKYPLEDEWKTFTDVAGSHGDYIDGFWDTFTDWDEGQEIHITHWMPLPQPPKGE